MAGGSTEVAGRTRSLRAMGAALPVLSGLLGLVVGSFLNVVIHRVPKKLSVVKPGSACPECSTPIAPRDNIPVLSWVLLRGRCRHCSAGISARYPLVELASGVLFVLAAVRFAGVPAAVPAYCVFLAALLAVSVIDLDLFIIPNRIVYPSLLAGAVLLAVASIATGDLRSLREAAIGGVGAFAALLVIHLISPRGMGFGDVRLSGVIGMNLGWISLGHVPLGLFLGFLSATLVSLPLLLLRRKGRKDPVPFGPFLAFGALVAVLVGQPILNAYLGI
jgi:leader peptidase (prepilin peptidase) / N-methyltransferase